MISKNFLPYKLYGFVNEALDECHFRFDGLSGVKFQLVDGKLYYESKLSDPLTKLRRGELRAISSIMHIIGIENIRTLGVELPKGRLTFQEATMLNKVEEELPSTSEVAKADDIELQEIMENAPRNIVQFDNPPLRDLLGLDKELRSITDSLKAEMVKKVQLEERIKRERLSQ